MDAIEMEVRNWPIFSLFISYNSYEMVQGRIWLLGPYFELFPLKNNNKNNNNNSQEALTWACAAGKTAFKAPIKQFSLTCKLLLTF